MRQPHIPDQKARDFAAALRRLATRDDRGTLAELRRFVDGRGPSVASWSALVRLGAPVGDVRRIDDYALAAGLFAVYHQGSAPNDVVLGNLGASFGSLCARDAVSSQAAERRLQELLGFDRESLPEQLRRAATLLRSKGVAIDWAALTCDLAHWDSPEREVQEAWMTGFVRSLAGVSEPLAPDNAGAPSSPIPDPIPSL